ncbi:TPA: helix-turn-helix domain-containing protein [Candidatus Avigastranaerophilus faecigallinarum]|nr:helix-turn-helix domain-containing protein [Candidatus Avigastranaerophilus faecigallinarum]
MKTNKDSIIRMKSSEMLYNFLENTHLHKKDFAQMIGVTLSYVYNLIDETIPFSTRSTTLERIATVMDISPEEFVEYKIPQDPILIDETTEFIREKQKEKNLSTVQFLKSFPRKQRLEIVDILRGARPIPLDWEEVSVIASILDVSKEEMYDFWEERMRQLLKTSGFNFDSNQGLANAMFACARNYVYKESK